MALGRASSGASTPSTNGAWSSVRSLPARCAPQQLHQSKPFTDGLWYTADSSGLTLHGLLMRLEAVSSPTGVCGLIQMSCDAGANDGASVPHEASQGNQQRRLQPLHDAVDEQVPGRQGAAAVPEACGRVPVRPDRLGALPTTDVVCLRFCQADQLTMLVTMRSASEQSRAAGAAQEETSCGVLTGQLV